MTKLAFTPKAKGQKRGRQSYRWKKALTGGKIFLALTAPPFHESLERHPQSVSATVAGKGVADEDDGATVSKGGHCAHEPIAQMLQVILKHIQRLLTILDGENRCSEYSVFKSVSTRVCGGLVLGRSAPRRQRACY